MTDGVAAQLDLNNLKDIETDPTLCLNAQDNRMDITVFTLRQDGKPGLAFWVLSGPYTYAISHQTGGVDMHRDYNAFYLRDTQLPRHVVDGKYQLALKRYGLIQGWYVFATPAHGKVGNNKSATENMLAFIDDARSFKFGENTKFQLSNVQITRNIFRTIVNCIQSNKGVIDLTERNGLPHSVHMNLEDFTGSLPEPNLTGPAVLVGDTHTVRQKQIQDPDADKFDNGDGSSAHHDAMARTVSLETPTATARKRTSTSSLPTTPKKRPRNSDESSTTRELSFN